MTFDEAAEEINKAKKGQAMKTAETVIKKLDLPKDELDLVVPWLEEMATIIDYS